MKKAEAIALVCGLLLLAALAGYITFSSRLAKAENQARKANEMLANMQRNHGSRSPDMTNPQSATVTPSAPLTKPIPAVRPIPSELNRHLPADLRPINGTLLLNRFAEFNINKGYGQLTVNNGLTADAFVKIIEGRRLMAAIYVRGNSSFVLNEIADGSYTILYRCGYGWLEDKRDFSRGKTASKFDNPLTYNTRVKNEGDLVRTFYDTITLTLHKVRDGNAPAQEISENEFNQYQ